MWGFRLSLLPHDENETVNGVEMGLDLAVLVVWLLRMLATSLPELPSKAPASPEGVWDVELAREEWWLFWSASFEAIWL